MQQLQERSIMEDQMTLEERNEQITGPGTRGPAARATDPETSHEAAASVQHITAKQRAVLDILTTYGPLTDEEIRNYHRAKKYPYQSDSGLRTRRHELVELGKVCAVMDGTKPFKRQTVSGRATIVWRAR
jgi:hypothetical protein